MRTPSEMLDVIEQFCKDGYRAEQDAYLEDPSWVHSVRTDVFEEVRDKIAELRKQNEKL